MMNSYLDMYNKYLAMIYTGEKTWQKTWSSCSAELLFLLVRIPSSMLRLFTWLQSLIADIVLLWRYLFARTLTSPHIDFGGYIPSLVSLQVQACGSVVTEEQPHAMLIPMEYFLMGYGLYRPSQINCSPRSPLNLFCVSPELLSPESMGMKLKPIKTRANLKS